MIHTVLSTRLRPHRRLLALCGLSALVHLALLELVVHGSAGAPALMAGQVAADDLVLRLAPASAPRREGGRRRHSEEAAAAPAGGAPPARPPATSTTASRAGAAASASDPAPPPAPSGPAAGQPAADASALVQMPGRYRVRMPDAVLLAYAQTREAPAAPPERLADAHIDWRSNGERYLLKMDGVLGRLSSQGGSGDAGVRPRSAGEERDGELLVTDFAEGQVLFRARGDSVPDSLGIQDRASLLMQLAGIGLAAPDQLQGTIDIVVAGAAEAAIERYQVAGLETLATPLGAIEAWHLAQRAAPGQARLEVWLAPQRGWLPVQLRLTGADGVATTQTVSAIAPQPNSAPAD